MNNKEIKKLVIECLKRKNHSEGWWYLDEIEEYVKNNAQGTIPKNLLEPAKRTKRVENNSALYKRIQVILSNEKKGGKVLNKKGRGLWKIKIQKPSIFGNDGEEG